MSRTRKNKNIDPYQKPGQKRKKKMNPYSKDGKEKFQVSPEQDLSTTQRKKDRLDTKNANRSLKKGQRRTLKKEVNELLDEYEEENIE